jgi:prophage tail gpP-like protein
MPELSLSIKHDGKVQTIRGFKSFSVDSDLYTAADEWEVALEPGVTVPRGAESILRIGGQTVLHGIVDRRAYAGSKNSLSYTISGRDLMGLVVDTRIEQGRTLKNKRLADVAELYLRDIPFVSRKTIEFGPGVTSLDVPQEYVQVEPGMSVFDLLMGIAVGRGIHFYMRADGTVVFGTPAGSGRSQFTILNREGNSTVKEFSFVDDMSQEYSTVTVLGQRQSGADVAPANRNARGEVQNDAVPFAKPFVLATQTDAQSPAEHARMLLEQQRAQSYQLSYTVSGVMQGSAVWTTDSLVDVRDDRLKIRGQRLIYGRRLQMSKTGGTTTQLRLGMPGVVI